MQVSSTANTFDNGNCVIIYFDWVCSFCLLVEQVLSEAVDSEHNPKKITYLSKKRKRTPPDIRVEVNFAAGLTSLVLDR